MSFAIEKLTNANDNVKVKNFFIFPILKISKIKYYLDFKTPGGNYATNIEQDKQKFINNVFFLSVYYIQKYRVMINCMV